MKRIQLGVVAVLLALTAAGCGGAKEQKDSDINGDIYPPAKAMTLLTGFPRWCYFDTDGDRVFKTHVFLPSRTGEYAIYNSANRSWMSAEAMTWNVDRDLLTMVLSKNNDMLRRKMRFRTEDGRTLLVLLNAEDQGKSTLYPCNL